MGIQSMISYTKMTKRITFGTKRLKEELNSEAFISGLGAIIKHTSDTGNEAGFKLYYSKEADTLVYPDYIRLGDKEKIKPVPDFDLPTNAPEFMREYENRDSIRVRRRNTRLEYPSSEDYKRRREEGRLTREIEPLTSIHTHPSNDVFPSGSDLRSNNAFRNYFHSNTNMKDRNPIGIVVGSPMVECPTIPSQALSGIYFSYHLFIFQENTETPIPRDSDFEELSIKLERGHLERKRLLHVFGREKDNYTEYITRDAYFYPTLDRKMVRIVRGHKLRPLIK